MNLSRRTFVISIITLVTLLILGGFIFWYFTTTGNTSSTNTIDQTGQNNLFPFGSGSSATKPNTSSTETDSSTTGTETAEIKPAAVARQITNQPVAGFTIVASATSSSVMYMERATGHIYQAALETTAQKRVANTTIPKTVEALWLPDNKTIIARSFNEFGSSVTTLIGSLVSSTSSKESSLRGLFLPENIAGIAVGGANDSLLYLKETAAGNEVHSITKDGKKDRLIFSSPIREWTASWPTATHVFLTTKPSALSEGISYQLDPTSGATTRLIGGLSGLITKPNPKGDTLLYSVNDNGITRLFVLSLSGGTPIELPIGTLADKCTWDPNTKNQIICSTPLIFPTGQYPDLWYQGLAHFEDDLWQINTATGQATLIQELKKITGTSIDVYNPRIDSSGNFIVFQNKNDLSLWSITLKTPTTTPVKK